MIFAVFCRKALFVSLNLTFMSWAKKRRIAMEMRVKRNRVVSRRSRIKAMERIMTISPITETRPDEIISFTASMSDTWRVIILPVGVLSK